MERAFAGKDLVEHQPQRIEITPAGNLRAGKLLRSHIGWSPKTDLLLGNEFGHFCETKVHDHDFAPAVQHDVGRLEIAVQHALVMRCGDACAKLARDLQSFVAGQATDAPQQRTQVFTIDVFHRQECEPVGFADVINAADVRMRDAASDPDFIAKSLQ